MARTTDEKIADALAGFYGKPLEYVMWAFPWDTDPAIQVVDWESDVVLIDGDWGKHHKFYKVPYYEIMKPYRERFHSRYGPDWWTCEILDQWGANIKRRGFDGTRAVAPIQYAIASGHGIGKTTLSAFIIKFIMDTRPFAKGTVTANTEAQLRTKTWAELGKWHRRSITSHWFTYNSGRGNMSLKHNEHSEEWYCSAQTCREENSEAFAGQHAANSTSFYLFDEGSAVPDKIYEVREGGTTDGEPMTFDFGNPTRNSGRFFEEVAGKFRKRYLHRKIDSRTVYITNKTRIQEWIEDYGVDSDFTKVRILGEFPSAGSLQFMPTDWVTRSMKREVVEDRHAPLIIGVDVARFGDDRTVIYPRMGIDARTYAPTANDGIYSGLDTVQVAQKVIDKIEWFRGMGVEPAGVMVDVTGLGAGVVDTLRHSGYEVIEVNFGTTPVFEPETYRYRSDEMWGRLRDGIKNTLVLPREDTALGGQLRAELTQREYGYTLQGNKIHLETKKDMKDRVGFSPDVVDALALTYAQDVAPSGLPIGLQSRPFMSDCDFDPTTDRAD